MKKNLICSFALWLVIELMLFIVFALCDSVIAAILFFALLLLSVTSYTLCVIFSKHISASIKFTAFTKKLSEASGSIILNNGSIAAMLKVFCCITAKNNLTGEREDKYISFYAPSKGVAHSDFTCRFKNCGYTEIFVSSIYLTDFFGFIPYKVKQFDATEAKCTVLPDTFDMTLIFDNMPIAIDDSESYSPNKKGNDYSETFQLREYVPGDGIKQIHWKLSEKLDKLIVREASLPVQKSTLVFWDKYADDGFSSKEADAMAEVTASVCQALSKSGTPFSVGWNENKKCIIENINSTEELITAIPQLLKCGADTEMSGAKRYFENYGCAAFSKIIYISKTIPDGYYDFAAQSSITPILCSAVPIDGAVTFNTDSYSESLNLLELAI